MTETEYEGYEYEWIEPDGMAVLEAATDGATDGVVVTPGGSDDVTVTSDELSSSDIAEKLDAILAEIGHFTEAEETEDGEKTHPETLAGYIEQSIALAEADRFFEKDFSEYTTQEGLLLALLFVLFLSVLTRHIRGAFSWL